MFGGSVRIMRK